MVPFHSVATHMQPRRIKTPPTAYAEPRRAAHFSSNEMFLAEPGNRTLASYPSTCWKCVA